MCACMSVMRMSLPCSLTLRAFRCVVMFVSRARRASKSRVDELISVRKILQTKKGGDLFLQVTNTGQYGTMTQPANFAIVKQIAVLHVGLVNQCLELAVIQAAGEDGVDNLHHDRHDVNEVGRLGANSLLVNDAVHLVYGLGMSGGLTVAHQQRRGALLLARHRWGTVGRHTDKAGEIEGVLLHTLKHRVKYVFPSCSATQRDKLEEFLTHIQFSGDPTDEDSQLGRVLYVGALIKSEGEGNEGRNAGLQGVVYVIRHLLDATTNGAGRKAHALKDRTLLRTDGVHHSDVALLDEVSIREWLNPASKDAGNFITGTHYLVGFSSLLAEERRCFLQVA